MTVVTLQNHYAYGQWANQRLFEALAQLTAEQFTEIPIGFTDSPRSLMFHILMAQRAWVERCGGAKRDRKYEPSDFPTAESLLPFWKQTEAQMADLLGTLQDTDLARIIEFSLQSGVTFRVTVGDALEQAAIHGIHHRGQISLLLRALGQAPGNFDYLFFARLDPANV